MNIRAFLVAFAVMIASFATFIFFWYELRLPILRTESFLLAVVSAAIALLTVIIFQSFRVSIAASSIAEEMAESTLVNSRELFTELYRGSPVPYLVVGKKGMVDSANIAAVRLFGVEMGWFEGKDIFRFLNSEKAERISLIEQYLAKHVPVNNVEIEIVRPDGGTRWVMLSLFPFTTSDRETKGLLTLVDITKQKEIDKAKTEFVSLASHQLRTPITAIKWNIELLSGALKERLSEGEFQYLEKIDHSVTRMDTLVTDFLSVSKLELGTFEVNPIAVSLTPFFNSILESHEKTAEARQITIEREWIDGDTVVADPHLLDMAINNLISNAIKYTRDGGVVRISSELQGSHRIISIADTGMGIPASEHDRIFTKIFRASNAKNEVPEGTGLGLYIAREAVRVMGGDITFVSTEGKGTTFTILLP
jgi:PAS domain S-box-containing protein